MSKYRSILAITVLAGILIFVAAVSNAAVEISFFDVANWPNGSNTVTLSWQTGSEFDIGAFNIWRSETNLEIDANEQLVDPNSVAENLTDGQSIAATCSGNTTANYSFEDTNADPTVIYYYYIEAIKCDTGSGFYGDGQLPNSDGNGLEAMNGVLNNTPTPLPTNTPTNTPMPTNTPTATNTPAPTNTPTATNTPAATNTPTATNTPVPTNTPTATPMPSGSTLLHLPIMVAAP